jgi:hypothetical protein
MPGPPTTNLGLTVPTVGGDSNTWGNELNNDLAILDLLGAINVVNTSVSLAAVRGIFPETLIRVTTGASSIVVTLPVTLGLKWTVKKIDSGSGSVTVQMAGGALIDGQASFVRTIQQGYVTVAGNGSSGDVIANN